MGAGRRFASVAAGNRHGMNLAMLIVGIACTLAGGYSAARREAFVARHRARADRRSAQPPMAYAVVGATLGLAGIVLILAAIS